VNPLTANASEMKAVIRKGPDRELLSEAIEKKADANINAEQARRMKDTFLFMARLKLC
jgi:hypothetical protein